MQVAAGGKPGDPRCPTCDCKLQWVGSGPAFLNREQWDAMKAGDYLLPAKSCQRPDCSGWRHSNGNLYWDEIKQPKPELGREFEEFVEGQNLLLADAIEDAERWRARAMSAEESLEGMSAAWDHTKADRLDLQTAVIQACDRLNESGTGEMGLIDTIHATHAILWPLVKDVPIEVQRAVLMPKKEAKP